MISAFVLKRPLHQALASAFVLTHDRLLTIRLSLSPVMTQVLPPESFNESFTAQAQISLSFKHLTLLITAGHSMQGLHHVIAVTPVQCKSNALGRLEVMNESLTF